ncbi:prepilin peptidase [Lapidilactobacillus wuchangensis]|uniref:prepilin peptidase n=1 Tax=Lapidilactobacillus wuchangensis TaxID=2486001 RepID=UPI000F771BE7|nr:A24 family peptidase [Lapidilactobacillus wuchangensis]
MRFSQNLFINCWLFIFGSCLGSFFTLLIDRWLTQREVVYTRSACEFCQTPLAYYDLCPVVGYLQQHGHCRYCDNDIPSHSLTAELLGGLSCCWLWQVHFWLQPVDIWLLFWLYLAALLDYRTQFVYQGILTTMVVGSMVLTLPYSKIQLITGLIFGLLLFVLQHWHHGLGEADLVWLLVLLFSHNFTWLLEIILISNLLVVIHQQLLRKAHGPIPYLPYLFVSYLLLPLGQLF